MLRSPITFRIRVSHQAQEPPSESLPAELGIQQGASRRSYNRHRPHRALQQASPLRGLPEPANLDQLKIQRRDRLGGIIHEYAQVA
jgi:hypothetical protein